jgi:large subunit ribosomal protein L17
MRHQKKINHLGRTSSHRKAMLSNMAVSLILHKRITTTLAKAKVLRTYIEPLINRAKDDSTHSRRMVFSYLQDKQAVTELFKEISKKIADRPGGYTRILKTGSRDGDNAQMCIIELVDYNETMLAPREDKKKTTRRRRAGTAKKAEAEEPAPKTRKKGVAAPVEEPVEEVPETPEDIAEDTTEETGEEPASGEESLPGDEQKS